MPSQGLRGRVGEAPSQTHVSTPKIDTGFRFASMNKALLRHLNVSTSTGTKKSNEGKNRKVHHNHCQYSTRSCKIHVRVLFVTLEGIILLPQKHDLFGANDSADRRWLYLRVPLRYCTVLLQPVRWWRNQNKHNIATPKLAPGSLVQLERPRIGH